MKLYIWVICAMIVFGYALSDDKDDTSGSLIAIVSACCWPTVVGEYLSVEVDDYRQPQDTATDRAMKCSIFVRMVEGCEDTQEGQGEIQDSVTAD